MQKKGLSSVCLFKVKQQYEHQLNSYSQDLVWVQIYYFVHASLLHFGFLLIIKTYALSYSPIFQTSELSQQSHSVPLKANVPSLFRGNHYQKKSLAAASLRSGKLKVISDSMGAQR